MIFPKYIKKNDTIAVTAPSNGITDEIKIKISVYYGTSVQDIFFNRTLA